MDKNHAPVAEEDKGYPREIGGEDEQPADRPWARAGSYLQHLRKAQGIGLRAFAKLLKVSPSFVFQIEQGDLKLPDKNVKNWARILGVEDTGEFAWHLVFWYKPEFYDALTGRQDEDVRPQIDLALVAPTTTNGAVPLRTNTKRENVGSYITPLRESQGLSRRELAERLHYAHQSSIWQVERGKIKVKPDQLGDWSRQLGVDLKELATVLFYYYYPGYFELMTENAPDQTGRSDPGSAFLMRMRAEQKARSKTNNAIMRRM